jgi:hypothetical protein
MLSSTNGINEKLRIINEDDINKKNLVYFDIFTIAQEIQVVEFPAEKTVCTIMYNFFNTSA